VAGVAAYPTRPPTPVDFRAIGNVLGRDLLNNCGGRLRSEDACWLLRNGQREARRRITHDLDYAWPYVSGTNDAPPVDTMGTGGEPDASINHGPLELPPDVGCL
jgi:hypothetical protein